MRRRLLTCSPSHRRRAIHSLARISEFVSRREAKRLLLLEHLQHRRGCESHVSLRSSHIWKQELVQLIDGYSRPSLSLRGKLEAAYIIDKGAP